MDHQIAASGEEKSFRKKGFPPKKTVRPPVEHLISEVAAVISEIGEVKEYRNRPPYRMVTIIPHGGSQPEQVVLPGAKAEPHIVMDALVALKAAGISQMILKLASAETWKNRRIEAIQVVPGLPAEIPAAVAVPVDEKPAPSEPLPPKPEVLETKWYNTSDGGDRQMIRLPCQGPLSKLFEGIGYFKRWYVDDKTIIVPTRQKSKMTYKSSAPRKDGSREVFFSGLKRYSTAAKLNAPTVELEAVPYNGACNSQSARPSRIQRRIPVTAIHVAQISGQHILHCPHCRNPLLKITADSADVPDGRTWLQDGDTVPGLRDRLTAEQRTPDGFDYELLVGTCRSCKQDYYVFEARFVDAPLAGVEHIMLQMARIAPERNFICEAHQPPEGSPRQWVLVEDVTPSGPMHTHLFGPFALKDEDGLVGPNGVSSCCGGGGQKPWAHAREVIHHWWDEMRSLNRAADSTSARP